MHKLISIFYYLAIFSLSFSSCQNTDITPTGEFATGVFIVNEGNFSDANGTISHYNELTNQTTQDVFAVANGIEVGGLIQSLYFHEDLTFIIDNLGSKIYVVNAESFEHITTISEGLNSPRYLTVFEGKAYVTNWGSYDENWNLSESFVAVIDLTTFEINKTISTDSGSEGIIVHGGKVFVANSYSNSIDIIDPETVSVVSQIEVEWGPQAFKQDKDGMYWILCSAFDGSSYLLNLDLVNEELVKTIVVAQYAKALDSNSDGDMLYYLSAAYGSDTEVYSFPIEAAEASTEPLLAAANIYGLGVHPQTGNLWLTNHNGFQGNGTALIYSGTQLKSSFPTGMGPNEFVFR